MAEFDTAAEDHRLSSGQVLADAGWLDTHFDAARPEYAAMLRAVPIEPGWRALHAGCGSGSYLPLLAELVGDEGRLAALDLAPENIEVVQQRLAAWRLDRRVGACVGSLATLPYPDGSFDLLWCANPLQYFADDDLPTVLAEFRRVVRPGGVVAVKDVDMQLWRVHPADPLLISHLSDASLRHNPGDAQSRGSVVGRRCAQWNDNSGPSGSVSSPPQRSAAVCRMSTWTPGGRYSIRQPQGIPWMHPTSTGARDRLWRSAACRRVANVGALARRRAPAAP